MNKCSHIKNVGIVGELDKPTVYRSNTMYIRLPSGVALLAEYRVYVCTSTTGWFQIRRSASK